MTGRDHDQFGLADDHGHLVESTRHRWLIGVRYGVHSKRLSPRVAFTLLMLGTYMNADGGRCWPSQARLALECNAGERTVRRHLEEAERLGWICRRRRMGAGQAWAITSYQASLPADVNDHLDEYMKTASLLEGAAKLAGPSPPSAGLQQEGAANLAGACGQVPGTTPEGAAISSEGPATGDKGAAISSTRCGQAGGRLDIHRDSHRDTQEREGGCAAPRPEEEWQTLAEDFATDPRSVANAQAHAAGAPSRGRHEPTASSLAMAQAKAEAPAAGRNGTAARIVPRRAPELSERNRSFLVARIRGGDEPALIAAAFDLAPDVVQQLAVEAAKETP